MIVIIACVVAVGIVLALLQLRAAPPERHSGFQMVRSRGSTDVACVRIGVDGATRRELADRLAGLDASRRGSAEALAAFLRQSVRVVAESEPGWRCAGALSFAPMDTEAAFDRFCELAEEARHRLTTPEVDTSRCRVAMVTFVVATRGALRELGAVKSRADVQHALSALASLRGEDLLALVVVPPRTDDGVDALEMRYPELVPLRDSAVS